MVVKVLRFLLRKKTILPDMLLHVENYSNINEILTRQT